jgi:hypothetical protein
MMWRLIVQTDEYEISLYRELNVCKNTIQRIKKSLGILERKHNKTTEAFIADSKSGKLTQYPEFKDDYEAWESSYDSLKRWEELEKQYQDALRSMKD